MAGLIITDLIANTLFPAFLKQLKMSLLKILPVLHTTWRHGNNCVNDIHAFLMKSPDAIRRQTT